MKKLLLPMTLLFITGILTGCGCTKEKETVNFEDFIYNEEKEIDNKNFDINEDNTNKIYNGNATYLEWTGTITLYRGTTLKNSFKAEITDVTDYTVLSAKAEEILAKIMSKTNSKKYVSTVDSKNNQETYDHLDFFYKNVTENKGIARYGLRSEEYTYSFEIDKQNDKYYFIFSYTGAVKEPVESNQEENNKIDTPDRGE